MELVVIHVDQYMHIHKLYIQGSYWKTVAAKVYLLRLTELRFEFTVRGFSKCDVAFVHYSIFESYSLSGTKVSSGAH